MIFSCSITLLLKGHVSINFHFFIIKTKVIKALMFSITCRMGSWIPVMRILDVFLRILQFKFYYAPDLLERGIAGSKRRFVNIFSLSIMILLFIKFTWWWFLILIIVIFIEDWKENQYLVFCYKQEVKNETGAKWKFKGRVEGERR